MSEQDEQDKGAWKEVVFPTTSSLSVHISDTQPDQTIELDCPPGSPRPGDLYPGVIAGTGLPKRVARSKFFGNWTWDYNDIPREKWERIQPTLKERISKLYESGVIRYGSW